MTRPCTGAATHAAAKFAPETRPAAANDPVASRTSRRIPRLTIPYGMRPTIEPATRRGTPGRPNSARYGASISARAQTTAAGAPVSGGGSRVGRWRRVPVQLELAGALLERGDHERDVLVEVHAEVRRTRDELVAVHRRGEGRLLHLLLDRLRRQAVDALGPHVRAGHQEPGELVDREERLLHRAVARDAEVVGVRGDRADHLRRLAEALELRHGVPRMPRLEVGMALVVEV